MNFRKRRRKATTLNTASTADISFMLLIFFLVTTSMEVDKGMPRQLPPYDDKKTELLQDIDKTKVLTLCLHKGGTVDVQDDGMAEGEPHTMKVPLDRKQRNELSRQLKTFLVTKGPEHVIELRIDRDADYESYFYVQNVLVRSYREIRNAVARKTYGKDFQLCSEEEKNSILAKYPQRIQEISVAN